MIGVDDVKEGDQGARGPFVIDHIFISHPDKDHYFGFQELFSCRKLTVQNVYHNGAVERQIRAADKDPGLKYFSKDRSLNPQRLPFFSMYDSRRTLQRDIVAAMSTDVKEMLNTAIPYAKNVELMAEKRMPVSRIAPTSKSGIAFRDLWREIKVRALDDYSL